MPALIPATGAQGVILITQLRLTVVQDTRATTPTTPMRQMVVRAVVEQDKVLVAQVARVLRLVATVAQEAPVGKAFSPAVLAALAALAVQPQPLVARVAPAAMVAPTRRAAPVAPVVRGIQVLPTVGMAVRAEKEAPEAKEEKAGMPPAGQTQMVVRAARAEKGRKRAIPVERAGRAAIVMEPLLGEQAEKVEQAGQKVTAELEGKVATGTTGARAVKAEPAEMMKVMAELEGRVATESLVARAVKVGPGVSREMAETADKVARPGGQEGLPAKVVRDTGWSREEGTEAKARLDPRRGGCPDVAIKCGVMLRFWRCSHSVSLPRAGGL